jgi:hypothetical protein
VNEADTYRELCVAMIDEIRKTTHLVGGPREGLASNLAARARFQLEKIDKSCRSDLQEKSDNHNGLYRKYNITKANGSPCDSNAKYFVLRLDWNGSDKDHVEACRMAARAYIKNVPERLQKVASELAKWIGL